MRETEEGQGERVKGQGFKSLTTWQRAYDFGLEIYKMTRDFPKEEQYGLVSQARRAAVSITANIAEGYERQYRKEYVQFLMMRLPSF